MDYRRDVLPLLRVEIVYANVQWTSRRGRHWRAPCPLHDDRDPRSCRFSVDTETLSYRCFSCGASGDALKWIAGGGPVTTETFRTAERLAGIYRLDEGKPKFPKPVVRQPPAHSTQPCEQDPRAMALWAATQTADATPAGQYLLRRLAWPPLDGWPLPDSVRWITADAVRRILRWPAKTLPRGEWAGCIAFGCSDPASSEVRAVKVEALDEGGRRCKPRWRRNIGTTQGLQFVACDLPGGRVHLGEGEVTALALAVRCQAQGRGMAIACGGTSGMTAAAVSNRGGRAVAIHSDRDRAGRIAARRLRRELRSNGIECEADGVETRESDGVDAADALFNEVRERAAIREADGSQPPDQAMRGAWRDTLSQLRAEDPKP